MCGEGADRESIPGPGLPNNEGKDYPRLRTSGDRETEAQHTDFQMPVDRGGNVSYHVVKATPCSWLASNQCVRQKSQDFPLGPAAGQATSQQAIRLYACLSSSPGADDCFFGRESFGLGWETVLYKSYRQFETGNVPKSKTF